MLIPLGGIIMQNYKNNLTEHKIDLAIFFATEDVFNRVNSGPRDSGPRDSGPRDSGPCCQ
jgi:hypothetical protein